MPCGLWSKTRTRTPKPTATQGAEKRRAGNKQRNCHGAAEALIPLCASTSTRIARDIAALGVGRNFTSFLRSDATGEKSSADPHFIIAMDPLVAWNQIKHCEHAVKFLGGERNKPRGDHGVIPFAMGRAPVGGGSWEPRFPAAAHLDPTLGIVPGKQQGMEIANVLQDEVIPD
jgi:hypothetical protein